MKFISAEGMKRMLEILKKTASEFTEDQCTRMAAALAYYTIFALAPLLILIVVICGLIWDPSVVEGTIKSEIEGVVGADGAQQVKTMLSATKDHDRGVMASVVFGVMLFVGATGVVGQLQISLNEAWDVKPDPNQSGIKNFIFKRVLSFGMICGIAFLLLVSLAVSSLVSAAGSMLAGMLPAGSSEFLLHALHLIFSYLVITILFAAMFKFLPDAKVAWSDVIVGAGLTALLFVIGKYAIGAYLGSKNMDSTYGAAGSLVLIMVWIYYSSIIFLFGAEFTQVWTKIKGSGIVPESGAIRAS